MIMLYANILYTVLSDSFAYLKYLVWWILYGFVLNDRGRKYYEEEVMREHLKLGSGKKRYGTTEEKQNSTVIG